MCGLARLTENAGFIVAGSDSHPSDRTRELSLHGIKVFDSQVASNIEEFKPDYLIKTAAILLHNEEVMAAERLGLQIFDRAEFLGRIYENL